MDASTGDAGTRGWGTTVDLNALDWEGNSPLHLACQISSQEVTCRLLLAGADPKARDQRGMTPFQQSRVGLKPEDFLSAQQQRLQVANQNKPGNSSKQDEPSKLPQESYLLMNLVRVNKNYDSRRYFQQIQHMLGATNRPFVRSVMDWLGRTLKGGTAAEEGGREVLTLPNEVAM